MSILLAATMDLYILKLFKLLLPSKAYFYGIIILYT